jgi:uridine kinase
MPRAATTVDLASVAAEIMSRPALDKPRLVGIDGPSGSGKTTLADRLVPFLGNVALLRTDDFASWSDLAGWWRRFDNELLTPLLAWQDRVRYQVRDWANDARGTSLGPWKVAHTAPTIVIEGVTCTRQEVADRVTYAIWIEAPFEVRLKRGLARDGESQRDLWLKWMSEEREFLDHDRTKSRADLRITT